MPGILEELTQKIDDLSMQVSTMADRQAMDVAEARAGLFAEIVSVKGIIEQFSREHPGDIPRQIAEAVAFKGDDANALYRAFIGTEKPLSRVPHAVPFSSSLCLQSHFALDQYRFWVQAMKDRPKFYRKQWEFFFIAQVLFERGLLAAGKRGLAFGVGREPLPALFASFGVEVVATDQSLDAAVASGWVQSNQHAHDLSALNDKGICTERMFSDLISFEALDMNNISSRFDGQFDFCWSACSLEHLGSLQHGLDFIENSMRSLRPGGIAVHTTEFNLSSDDQTIESPGLSVYRRKDIEGFLEQMAAKQFSLLPVDWTVGDGFAEQVVDLPPFGRGEPHIRLRAMDYDVTSIGLVIEKAPA